MSKVTCPRRCLRTPSPCGGLCAPPAPRRASHSPCAPRSHAAPPQRTDPQIRRTRAHTRRGPCEPGPVLLRPAGPAPRPQDEEARPSLCRPQLPGLCPQKLRACAPRGGGHPRGSSAPTCVGGPPGRHCVAGAALGRPPETEPSRAHRSPHAPPPTRAEHRGQGSDTFHRPRSAPWKGPPLLSSVALAVAEPCHRRKGGPNTE